MITDALVSFLGTKVVVLIRNAIPAVIASSGACITSLYEGWRDGSRFLDFFSRVYFPFRNCFIVDSIAFHESSIGWNNMCLHVQPTEYLPKEWLTTGPSPQSTALDVKTNEAIKVSSLYRSRA